MSATTNHKKNPIAGLFAKNSRGNVSVDGQDLLGNALAQAVAPGDASATLVDVLKNAVQELGATAGYALLAEDKDQALLKSACAFSPKGPFSFPNEVHTNSSFSGQAIQNRQPVLVRADETGLIGESEFGPGVKAALSVPLLSRALISSTAESSVQAVGALTFVSLENPQAFDQRALKSAQAFANLFALTLANYRAEKYRRKTVVECLEQISTFVESKDQYRAGHSARTARICAELAQKLGLDEAHIEELRIAATLMDVGYVSIPDHILQKPEGLTDYEFLLVRMHPVVSYEICQKLQLPESILTLVRSHHEKLDGSGYPDQLCSSEIPLPLRILTTADTYDAMRCPRPHRPGLSQTETIRLLLVEVGTKHDPLVVQALRELSEEGKLEQLYEKRAA